MRHKRLVIWSLVALAIIVACLAALPMLNSVRIVAPMLGIPVLITRDGREVQPAEIRAVQYRIDESRPKPPNEMHSKDLRDATVMEGYYFIAASFSIYYHGSDRTHPEVKPAFQSVFLRVTFADGKTVSMSYPIISDTRENTEIHVDLSDTHQ